MISVTFQNLLTVVIRVAAPGGVDPDPDLISDSILMKSTMYFLEFWIQIRILLFPEYVFGSNVFQNLDQVPTKTPGFALTSLHPDPTLWNQPFTFLKIMIWNIQTGFEFFPSQNTYLDTKVLKILILIRPKSPDPDTHPWLLTSQSYILSVPKFTANLYCISKDLRYTWANAV